MNTPFTSSDVLRRTRSFRFLPAPLIATALGIGAIVAGRGEVMIKPLIALGVTAAMLGGVASFVAFVFALFGLGKRETAGELAVSDAGVDFGGRRLVDRDHIKAGFIVPHASTRGLPIVALSTRLGTTHELVVPEEAVGRHVLTALGLDASQTVAQFSLAWRHAPIAFLGVFAFAVALSIALAAAGAVTAGAGFLLVRFVAPLVSVLPMLALRSKLAVGADGVLVTEPGNQEFVRYADVDDVRVGVGALGRSRSLLIALRSGKTLTFRTTGSAYFDAVVERIREARATHERGDAAPAARILERGHRPMIDWIRALRATGSGADADARTASVEPQRLWRIVEDPGGAPAARAAAAIALGPSLDAAGRARLADVAEATASPKLRVALSAAAASDEDENLERALGALEADPDTSRPATRA
jgi:hypothetical protein